MLKEFRISDSVNKDIVVAHYQSCQNIVNNEKESDQMVQLDHPCTGGVNHSLLPLGDQNIAQVFVDKVFDS